MARYARPDPRPRDRVAEGELVRRVAAVGRSLARAQQSTEGTVKRAYRELAEAGAIVLEPRRVARVSASGPLAARALLREGAVFRLAGSDDPALSVLIADVPEAIEAVGAAGQLPRADGAVVRSRRRGVDASAPPQR